MSYATVIFMYNAVVSLLISHSLCDLLFIMTGWVILITYSTRDPNLKATYEMHDILGFFRFKCLKIQNFIKRQNKRQKAY